MAVPWSMTCKCRSRHSFSLLCCAVSCVVGYAVSHAASLHFRCALLTAPGGAQGARGGGSVGHHCSGAISPRDCMPSQRQLGRCGPCDAQRAAGSARTCALRRLGSRAPRTGASFAGDERCRGAGGERRRSRGAGQRHIVRLAAIIFHKPTSPCLQGKSCF